MGLTLISSPELEPVTTAQAKTQCRISSSTDDSYIDSLVKAAREQIESFCSRALLKQTWRMTLDSFPCFGTGIDIPVNPLIAVNSITYVDTNGVTQTWDSSQYQVDTSAQIGRIVPAYAVVYPVTRYQINAVTIEFDAGYGELTANVPESFKLAIKLMVAHWYFNRGEQGMLPDAAIRLISPFALMVNP